MVAEAPQGALFRVQALRVGGEVGKRLADMGFTEGAEGVVVRGGFLRGPLQVRIRGYDILIRRSEAAAIEVEPLGEQAVLAEEPEGGAAPGKRRRFRGARAGENQA